MAKCAQQLVGRDEDRTILVQRTVRTLFISPHEDAPQMLPASRGEIRIVERGVERDAALEEPGLPSAPCRFRRSARLPMIFWFHSTWALSGKGMLGPVTMPNTAVEPRVAIATDSIDLRRAGLDHSGVDPGVQRS